MTQRMLDTNICIYLIKNKPPSVLERFKAFEIGDLCLSSITVSELMYGAYKSQHTEKNLTALEHFLMPFEIVEYGVDVSVHYGKIRADLEKRGQVIGNMDMQIAAHALAIGAVLVTNNLREFERIATLKVENWV